MPPDQPRIPASPDHAAAEHERRVELLIRLLPPKMQRGVRWLREPSRRWFRMAAAVLLLIGGLLWFLPVLGLWMLPLGLLLLAEDVKPVRHATGRVLAWIERRRPHWLGLPYVRER